MLVAGGSTGTAWADVKDGVEAWSRGDFEAAVRQWQNPADKGDPDALFNLGQAYKLGRGVPRDLTKAEELYRQAAQKGHARAADNYGILLFQTNRQAEAMTWLNASAERGEPRAMYIAGIAAYNGDFAPRDWVRAYALMTRAAATGLPAAMTSLTAMNDAIPLEQRQLGASLAQELEQKAGEARSRDLAAADLGAKVPKVPTAATPAAPPKAGPLRTQTPPAPLQIVDIPPAQTSAPVVADLPKPVAAPVVKPVPAPKPQPAPSASNGAYRIQFGAFGVKANADALWNRLRGRAEVSGHPRIDAGSGVTRLQAGNYSENAAERACTSLRASGQTCVVVRP